MLKYLAASLFVLTFLQAPAPPPPPPPQLRASASPAVTVDQLARALKRIDDLEARVAALEKARGTPKK